MCVNAIFEERKKNQKNLQRSELISFERMALYKNCLLFSSSSYLSVMWIVFHCLQRSPAARGIWPQYIPDSLHKLRFPTW